jgi:hypothetical protein
MNYPLGTVSGSIDGENGVLGAGVTSGFVGAITGVSAGAVCGLLFIIVLSLTLVLYVIIQKKVELKN